MCEEVKTKVCSKCGRELPLTREYFYCDRRTKDGFLARCKQCKDQADKEYRTRNHDKVCQRRRELYNPEKAKITSAKYRETHREELKVKKKEYYDEHRDEILEQKKIYHQENKERINDYNRQYSKINRDRLREYAKNRYEQEKDKILTQHKEYYADNSELIKSRVAEYRKNNKGKIYEGNKRYYQTQAGIESRRRAGHIRKARTFNLKATFTPELWGFCKEYFGNNCAYCGKKHVKLTQDHFIPVVKGGTYTVDNILPACRSCNSSKQDFDFKEWYPKQPFFTETRLKKIYKYLNYDGDCLQIALDL
jgi:hypothetical protein